MSGTSTSKIASSTRPAREKWTDVKLKHTAAVRSQIMSCIQRLNAREHSAIERAVLNFGNGHSLPMPNLRADIRRWYHQRWLYLLSEYEAILPHVEELPDEQVASIVRAHLMEKDDDDARKSR